MKKKTKNLSPVVLSELHESNLSAALPIVIERRAGSLPWTNQSFFFTKVKYLFRKAQRVAWEFVHWKKHSKCSSRIGDFRQHFGWAPPINLVSTER